MLSTTHTTDLSSMRQWVVHRHLTADLNMPQCWALSQVQIRTSRFQHPAGFVKMKEVMKDKDYTHTCLVRACSGQRGLVWFQVAPWWRGSPAQRRERRSWLRGFYRAALCHLLRETECSGSLGSSLAWGTQSLKVSWRRQNNNYPVKSMVEPAICFTFVHLPMAS